MKKPPSKPDHSTNPSVASSTPMTLDIAAQFKSKISDTKPTTAKMGWNLPEQDVDAQFVSPICFLGTILGLVPINSYQDNCVWIRKRGLSHLYAIFILVVILFGSALSAVGRVYDVYPNMPSSTIVITDVAVQLSTVLTNVVCVWAPAFGYFGYYEGFISKFLSTTSCLYQDRSLKTKRCRVFYRCLIISHLIIFLMFAFDAYIWINIMGMKVFRNYIFRDVQNYHLYIMAMVMHNFTLTIRYRFQALNEHLTRVSSSQGKLASVACFHANSEKMERARAVRKATQVYLMLVEQVTYFNKIFGWQILLFTLAIMMGLLNSLDLLTVFTVFEKGIEGSSESLIYGLVILTLIWAHWMFTLGIGLTTCCYKAVKEAQCTADVCFQLLLKLPVDNENYEERALKQELNLLKQLSTERSPTFSAAGFFSVDYSLLLALFGSVTSYIIVLIQFNK